MEKFRLEKSFGLKIRVGASFSCKKDSIVRISDKLGGSARGLWDFKWRALNNDVLFGEVIGQFEDEVQ